MSISLAIVRMLLLVHACAVSFGAFWFFGSLSIHNRFLISVQIFIAITLTFSPVAFGKQDYILYIYILLCAIGALISQYFSLTYWIHSDSYSLATVAEQLAPVVLYLYLAVITIGKRSGKRGRSIEFGN